MKFVGVFNPTSGRGRAEKVASEWREELSRAGHELTLCSTSDASWKTQIGSSIAASEALIVIGGDGTVHAAAPLAIEAERPVYHAPMGTENLFAREFKMNREPATFLRALDTGAIEVVDTAMCNETVLLLMCSVGFDARVVHRLAAQRNGPIRHASYVKPILQELFDRTKLEFDVQVDGQAFVERARGTVIVANSCQYAARLNPARHALMDDGVLDVVFLPIDGVIDFLSISIRAGLNALAGKSGVKFGRGETVFVRSNDESPLRYQVDGEAAAEQPKSLSIDVRPGTLRVISPRAAVSEQAASRR